MAHNALLIVDVQRDFCPGGALAVPHGYEVVAALNAMIRWAKDHRWLIIASRDWHPRRTTHFAEFGGKWPVHCVEGTSGAEFHSSLDIEGAIIVSKGMGENEDAYSAFDGITARGVRLEDLLRSHEVDNLYGAGLATEYCDKATVLDAKRKGFNVFLLLDACRAVDVNPGDGERAIEEMRASGVVITTTQAVMSGAA